MSRKNEIIRRSVVFNLSNPLHKDLYEWCNMKSSNFSDFVRVVLFNYKNNEFLFNKTDNVSVVDDKDKKKKYPLKNEGTSNNIDNKNTGISIKIDGKSLKLQDKEAMNDFL